MSTDAPAKLSYSDISDWVWNEFRTGAHFDASQITSGVFAVDRVPGLPASKLTSGEISVNRVPGLPASKITSGEVHVDRIPQLDAATKIIGVLPISLGGTGSTTAADARLNLGVSFPATETPEAPTKEGSVGNLSTIFARGDHSHPEQTTIAYVAAPSTQATDTLPIALESPAYPGSESSYSGFYSPADGTLVMRTGQDSYKFEYNKVTLGEDVSLIGRNDGADIILYISGASAATKGGTIALGGSNYPSLSLIVDNETYLYLSKGAAYPVAIYNNTYVRGNLETSGSVSADALYGNSAQSERMILTPIERADLPGSMPSSGVMYFDATDSRFYGRNNNDWEILNSKNADFTLAGLSEKSYNSLTDKPTYAGSSSAGGAANSVANTLVITLNGGTTEGLDKFTFDGSESKSINIVMTGQATPDQSTPDQSTPDVALDFLKTSIDLFSCAEFEEYPALLSAPVLRLITMPSELTTPHIFEWINEGYSVGVATYTDGPAHGKGDQAFFCSTLLPNGKVMLTPHGSANIGIYDPIANTYTDGPTHGMGSNAFLGSTLLPNGKVMLTPYFSTRIGIYDPIANTYTNGPAHRKDNGAFRGSTLMPNGKVMLTPNSSANIGIYDPVTNTYTNGPTHGRGLNAFYGNTLMPNGKVMLAPYCSPNIGIYDPIANTYTDGPAHGKGSNAFIGSTLMPNGKVMLTPTFSGNIGIYDPVANTYTNGPTHGRGLNAFYGSTLLPNGKVMLTPFNSANIGIYDPVANTYTDGPEHGKNLDAFYGSTLLPNGKVMLTPRDSANIGIYDPAIIDLELRNWPLLSAYFNKF